MIVFSSTVQSMYQVLVVDRELFDAVPKHFLISHSDSRVKYMCANQEESEWVSLYEGVLPYCDYFKIILI